MDLSQNPICSKDLSKFVFEKFIKILREDHSKFNQNIAQALKENPHNNCMLALITNLNQFDANLGELEQAIAEIESTEKYSAFRLNN